MQKDPVVLKKITFREELVHDSRRQGVTLCPTSVTHAMSTVGKKDMEQVDTFTVSSQERTTTTKLQLSSRKLSRSAFADKQGLLGSHSKGAMQNSNSLIWQVCLRKTFVEQKLWRLQQLEFNENKSVRRLYDKDVPAPQWPDVQLPPEHGSEEHLLHLLLQMQGLVLKRRLFKEETCEEGFGE